LLLAERAASCLAVLTVAAVVLRSELVLLIAPISIELLVRRKLPLLHIVATGVVAALCGVAASVAIDSVLWRRWLWPEGELLYFNLVLGKSVEWGTSPWHWYAS